LIFYRKIEYNIILLTRTNFWRTNDR